MNLVEAAVAWASRPMQRAVSPTTSTLTFQQFVDSFKYGGVGYPLSGIQQTLGGNKEATPDGFTGYVSSAYAANGIVFACMMTRMLHFSEARFQFRRLENGRPGDLFGTAELAPLERPEPGKTTGDLLARAIQDVDLAGNFYAIRQGSRIVRLRPDWVSLVLGSTTDPDVDAVDPEAIPLGLIYWPGGPGSGKEPRTFLAGQFAHFAPIPDPVARYRGMSWLTPIVREIMADSAATTHKLTFFEHGATPNMVVSLDPAISQEAFDQWVAGFRQNHEGLANAYKTLYLGGGAKVEVVGSDLQQLSFKTTQGAGETRIAAAAGVPPVIVGLSEGLQAATYSNYGQARRRFADGTIRPLWRNFAGSMETIIRPPAGAQLWFDDRDIPFLREDARDVAEIQGLEARTIRSLVDAGYDPITVVKAVESQDWSFLKHSGLYSVQLQPPQPDGPPTESAPSAADDRSLATAAYMELARAAVSQPTNVYNNIDPGAFQVSTTIDPGAVQVSNPITVEAPTTIDPGAFQISHVTADKVDIDGRDVGAQLAADVRDVLERPTVREIERDGEGRPVRVVERRGE